MVNPGVKTRLQDEPGLSVAQPLASWVTSVQLAGNVALILEAVTTAELFLIDTVPETPLPAVSVSDGVAKSICKLASSSARQALLVKKYRIAIAIALLSFFISSP